MSGFRRVQGYAEAELTQALANYGTVAEQWRTASDILRTTGVVERASRVGRPSEHVKEVKFKITTGRGTGVDTSGNLQSTSRTTAVTIRTAPSLSASFRVEHPSRFTDSRHGVQVHAQTRDFEGTTVDNYFGWRHEQEVRVAGNIMLLGAMQNPEADPKAAYAWHEEAYHSPPGTREVDDVSTIIEQHAGRGLGMMAQLATAMSIQEFNPTTPGGPNYLVAAEQLAVLVTTAAVTDPIPTSSLHNASVPQGLIPTQG